MKENKRTHHRIPMPRTESEWDVFFESFGCKIVMSSANKFQYIPKHTKSYLLYAYERYIAKKKGDIHLYTMYSNFCDMSGAEKMMPSEILYFRYPNLKYVSENLSTHAPNVYTVSEYVYEIYDDVTDAISLELNFIKSGNDDVHHVKYSLCDDNYVSTMIEYERRYDAGEFHQIDVRLSSMKTNPIYRFFEGHVDIGYYIYRTYGIPPTAKKKIYVSRYDMEKVILYRRNEDGKYAIIERDVPIIAHLNSLLNIVYDMEENVASLYFQYIECSDIYAKRFNHLPI